VNVPPRTCLLLLCVMIMAGCGGSRSVRGGSDDGGVVSDGKLNADAYAFDARLKRDGKPTTFQLEVYCLDTLIGLAGKGYLGKGALKGRLSKDSLEVYFPSSNEFLHESLDDLLESSACPLPLAQLNLFRLFKTLPDSVVLPDGIVVESDYGDADRPEFVVSADGCSWSINLSYDHHDSHWRVRRFLFEDGETSLRGQRTRYRGDVRLPVKRFQVPRPSEALRIIP